MSKSTVAETPPIKDRRVKGKKKWYKSRTIWLNALIGGLGAAQVAMTAGASGWDLLGVAVVNGALRGATKQGIN